MNTLILETSCEKACLVLSQDGSPLATRPLPGGPELSKRLALEVQSLLHQHSFQPHLIGVGTGPGSYTGIRVGAALAKSLSYGWKIPLIGFCSLKGFAPPIDGPFAILTDARSGGLYTLFGERKGLDLAFEKPLLLLPTDPSLQRVAHLASPHPEAIKKKGSFSAKWFETSPDPAILAWLAHRQFSTEGEAPLELSYLSCP